MKTNPILEEIRAVRDKDAALVGNDVHRLFALLRYDTHTMREQDNIHHQPEKAMTTWEIAAREDAPKKA